MVLQAYASAASLAQTDISSFTSVAPSSTKNTPLCAKSHAGFAPESSRSKPPSIGRIISPPVAPLAVI